MVKHPSFQMRGEGGEQTTEQSHKQQQNNSHKYTKGNFQLQHAYK